MKKALALILCLVMLLGVFPMSAVMADEEERDPVSESGKTESDLTKESEEVRDKESEEAQS